MTAPSIAAPRPTPTAVPLRGPAVTASTLVWLAVAGPATMTLSIPTFGATQSTSTAQRGMALFFGGNLLAIAGYLVAGVAVMVWLRRARRNADVLSTAPHRLPAGWAVGAWFVPVGALVLPFLVVADVLRATSGPDRSMAVPHAWWAAWICGGFVAPWACGAVLLVPMQPSRAAAVLTLVLIVQLVAVVVAAATFTRIATGLAAEQDARIRALPA